MVVVGDDDERELVGECDVVEVDAGVGEVVVVDEGSS